MHPEIAISNFNFPYPAVATLPSLSLPLPLLPLSLSLSLSLSRCLSTRILVSDTEKRERSNMLDTIVAFIVMQKLELMLDVEQFGSRLDTIDRTVGSIRNMQI